MSIYFSSCDVRNYDHLTCDEVPHLFSQILPRGILSSFRILLPVTSLEAFDSNFHTTKTRTLDSCSTIPTEVAISLPQYRTDSYIICTVKSGSNFMLCAYIHTYYTYTYPTQSYTYTYNFVTWKEVMAFCQ